MEKKPVRSTSDVKKTAVVITPKAVDPRLYSLVASKGAHKKRKLLGRGSSSGHGKTSTRGSKGQTSRSGRATYPGFEGGQSPLIRKMPKRGFTSKFAKEYQIVNLSSLAALQGATITPQLLWEQGLVKSKNKLVKILGDGEISGAVTVQAHAFSRSAVAKIEKAGGKTEVVHA